MKVIRSFSGVNGANGFLKSSVITALVPCVFPILPILFTTRIVSWPFSRSMASFRKWSPMWLSNSSLVMTNTSRSARLMAS